MSDAMARWRETTLAEARAAQQRGDGHVARALAAMVRDSIPQHHRL
jgi:hypothetical protein